MAPQIGPLGGRTRGCRSCGPAAGGGIDRGVLMRILHLAPHCDEVGNGVVNVAVDLAIKQREAGHVVGLASAGGSMQPMLEAAGVRHFGSSMTWARPWRSEERRVGKGG